MPALICVLLACSVSRGYIHINGFSASKYAIKGVDVSHYQGEIDWSEIREQGIGFAYIKATEGSSHVDDRFAYNYENAKNAGIRAGAYHFFSFDSPGKTQAENFINNVGEYSEMLPPAADVEFYGDKRTNRPDAESVRKELKDFLGALEERYKTKPVIYVTEDIYDLYIDGYFRGYPLWVRSIWGTPPKGIEWTFWQYTDKGRLEGFAGDETYIDLNVFSGTKEEWEVFR